MRRCYLHAKAHKTGSTSIQKCFADFDVVGGNKSIEHPNGIETNMLGLALPGAVHTQTKRISAAEKHRSFEVNTR